MDTARAPLPPGWEEMWDPASGRAYFSDVRSGATSWECPPPLPPPPPPPPPRGPESAPPPRQDPASAPPPRQEPASAPPPPLDFFTPPPSPRPLSYVTPPEPQRAYVVSETAPAPTAYGYCAPLPPSKPLPVGGAGSLGEHGFGAPPPRLHFSSQHGYVLPPAVTIPPPLPPPPPPLVRRDSLAQVYPPPGDAVTLSQHQPQLQPQLSDESTRGSAFAGFWARSPSGLGVRSSSMRNATSMGAERDGFSSVLVLEMSASGLRTKGRRKCCAVVVVQVQDARGGWTKLGQTEVVEHNPDPHWETRIPVDYKFGELQELRFVVHDAVSVERNGNSVQNTHVLGELKRTLGDLLHRRSPVFGLFGDDGGERGRVQSNGRLCIRVHESNGVGTFFRIHLTLSATNLDRADGVFRRADGKLRLSRRPFARSDPYLTIKQLSDDNGLMRSNLLCNSNMVEQDLNPKFNPLCIDVATGDGGLEDARIEIVVTDYDKNKKDDPLGFVRCVASDLKSGQSFDIINKASRKHRLPSYVNSGELRVDSATAVEYPSHAAYLVGGCRIKPIFAVDMTANGGLPADPQSSHYSDEGHPSTYERALKAIADVVEPYMPGDGMFTALAFGAMHSASSAKVSHAFPLNPAAWSSGDARVQTSDTLVQAYKACLETATMYSETRLSDILELAMKESCDPLPTQQDQHYTVLFVLTNGGCEDMDATIRKICKASRTAALSVVLVGIGAREDWSEMEHLDADGTRLQTGDKSMTVKRDIVDFVQYDRAMGADSLASEVLREVPLALREYFAERGIMPNPPSQ